MIETVVQLPFDGAARFGREDWPLDAIEFHVVDGRAAGFSVFYNGIMDGYYARVAPSDVPPGTNPPS